MLRMAQVQYIKDLYENEEKSLREISCITGHSFETVQKYTQKENWNEDNLPDAEPTSYPVLGEFIPIVDGWLEADRKVPRKQRHTAWRLFCRLRDEYGFRGSYSSVKRYVRKKKYVMKVQSAGFLPLERTPGCGQVDFGEFLYYDAGGQEQKGYALTISFPHSNMGYTQAFPSQNQECLLEGMKRIFEHMGGVPPRLRFDNMTTMPLVVSGAVTSRMMKSMTGRSMWQPFAKSPEQWKTPGSSTRCRNSGRLTWPPHKAKSARTPYNFSAKS